MMKLVLSSFLAILCCQCATAQTGMHISQLKKADSLIPAFMKKWGIDGGSVAIAYGGKLIYNRAFGYADQDSGEVAYPHHLYRIASISKPVTSIAIMQLVEKGSLKLTDTVFGTGKIIDNAYYSAVITDSRIYNITVQQLLEHTAGWDRDISCDGFSGCDPIGFPLHVTKTLGESNPVTDSALIKFLLTKGLNYTPGTTYAYSNIGYLILAKVIERKTGTKYADHMQAEVFSKMGICDIKIAKNLLKDKLEREAEYNATGTTMSCYDSSIVPWQYGGLNVEAMHAHGGWATTAKDLVKLFIAVDSYSTYPDILLPSTIATMRTASTANAFYAKGWSVNSANNWWHTGSLPGTATFMARTKSGYVWALLFNNRSSASGSFWGDLDALPWSCISGITIPTIDLFPPEDNVEITSAHGTGGATIDWTNGSGDGRLIVVHEDSVLTSFPIDSVSYTANTTYGSGSSLGPKAYVVYDGASGSSVNTNGYQGWTKKYWVTAFEYYNNTNTLNGKVYKLDCRSTREIIFHGGVGNINIALISLVPNPAHNTIQVGGLKGAYAIEIHDCMGKAVLHADVRNNAKVDISQLPAGMYIATVKNETGVVTRKLVKL